MTPVIASGLALVAGFAIGVAVDHHFKAMPEMDLSKATFAMQPPPAINDEHPCTVTRDNHDNIGYNWCEFSKAQDYPLDMLPAERGKLRCDDDGTGTPTLFMRNIDVGRVSRFNAYKYAITAKNNSSNQMQPGPWMLVIDCVLHEVGTAEPKP